MEDQIFLLDSQIYAIRCYTGEVVTLTFTFQLDKTLLTGVSYILHPLFQQIHVGLFFLQVKAKGQELLRCVNREPGKTFPDESAIRQMFDPWIWSPLCAY